MPACAISGMDYDFTTDALTAHPEQYFNVRENRKYKFEAEGWITVAGPGATPGAQVAMFAPAGSIGEFSVTLDDNMPVRVTNPANGVGANIPIADHKYRIAGTLETGANAGTVGIRLAKNNGNAGTVTSRRGCWLDGMVENGSAE